MIFDFKYKESEEVIRTIRDAGREVLKLYRKGAKSHQKKDKSPVTEADFASEKIILQNLKKYNYAILSEETADSISRLKSEKVWIVDPLDGTQDFIEKTGEFSIMIGLAKEGTPILGVVYQPAEDKLYFAEKGNGSYLIKGNASVKRLSAASTDKVSEGRFVFSRSHLGKEEKKFIKRNNIKNKIFMGSVGLKIGLIAEGRTDCYISFTNKTCQWDICAPEIILEEAGGVVTDLKREKFVYNRKEKRNLNGILAANKNLHSRIAKILE